MRNFCLGIALSAVVLLAQRTATAEIFVLHNGGRVVGKVLNPEERPRRKYVVEVVTGGQITLSVSQVKQKLPTRPAELEYERIRPQYADTVEGQKALADWCYNNRLLKQRKAHLKRICELDPDHLEARRLLGYQKYNGEWVTRDERMAKEGYRSYKGRYRTLQEIELMERRRKDDLAQKEWYRKILRWRESLWTDRDPEARQSLLAITDPYAVDALTKNLKKEKVPQARLLYVEILGNIGSGAANQALCAAVIEDPVEEVRLTCLDHLAKVKRPAVTEFFVKELKHKDNRIVNRAAIALGKIGDPSAVAPLIDALITIHKFKEVKKGGDGAMTSTFGTGPGGSGAPGGGGLSMGGSPKIYRVPFRNSDVMDALVALTGQNFNFDQPTWKRWYTLQQQQGAAGLINSRRD